MRPTRLAILAILLPFGLAAGQRPEPPPLPEDQQRAERVIERKDGYISRDEKAPGQPVTGVDFGKRSTDADLELLAVFPPLKRVSIHECQITDAGLERLSAIRTLEAVDIRDTPITDAGLTRLSSLPALRYLSVARCPITDAGLAPLAGLPALEDLHISDCPITDAGLAHLAMCPRLRFVQLDEAAVTDEGVDRLKELMPYTLISARRRSDARPWQSPVDGLVWRVALILALGAVVAGAIHRLLRAAARRRAWGWKLPVVVSFVVAMAVALLAAAPVAYPVRDGDAPQFWLHACGIDLGVRNPQRGFLKYYLPRDGWFVYYDQGFHGQFLRRVPAADAEALFPRVVERFRNAPPGMLHADVEAGFREWERSGAGPDDAVGLLVQIREARLNRLQKTNPQLYQYVRPEEDYFNDRWARIRRFHWDVWFEFAFLTFVILFAAWPWLRDARRWQWASHLALLPPLFCLPFWLGYAPLTFTSAGDQEVVLYPWLLMPLAGLPWTELDTAVLRALPKPLAPLSQTSGPMLSLSGFGAPGPVAVTVLGLLVGAAVLGIPVLIRRRAQIGRWLSAAFRYIADGIDVLVTPHPKRPKPPTPRE